MGPRFKPVHEHLDLLVDEYRAYSDMVAEYLSTIGIAPDGRAVRVAGDSALDPVAADYIDDTAVIEAMADRIRTVTPQHPRAPTVAETSSFVSCSHLLPGGGPRLIHRLVVRG